MNYEMLENIFNEANKSFLRKEKRLIEKDVSERSWCSRLAIYLEHEIEKYGIQEEYYVDTEYNRNGYKPKTTYDMEKKKEQKIVCDLIIHSRGENKYQDNLLCIEMKKSNRSEISKEKDKVRLKLLTKKSFDGEWTPDGKTLPEHVCGYLLGIYYEVSVDNGTIYLEFYKNGESYKVENIALENGDDE